MNRTIALAITTLFLLAGCGQAEERATSVLSGITVEPPAATPTTMIPTAAPPTPTASPPLPPPSAPAPVHLADSGQRLGSARGWDVSLGDLDGDGDLDAFVANESPADQGNAVWLNDGHGRFVVSDQSLGHGMGVELGDMDGDGDLDAFITSWHQASTVWINDGGAQQGTPGRFSDSGQNLGGPDSWDVTLGDLDGDGDLDAIIAKSATNTVWLNDGGKQGGKTGVFTDSGQQLGAAYTAAVGLGDLDGDGDLDALTVGWDEPGRVWFNNGTGLMTDSGNTLTPGHVHIHGMALGDLDGDDDLDVFLAGAPNQAWFNDGSGAFSEGEQKLAGLAGDSVALGDLDRDGDLDAFLAIGDWAGSADKVWLNEGDGRFVDSGLVLSAAFSSGVGLGDLDGDGDLDAFVTHGDLGKASGGGIPDEVWQNIMVAPETAPATAAPTPAEAGASEKQVSFVESDHTVGDGRSTDVSLGDLDGDGDLDAMVANQGEADIWLNDGTGHFTASGQELLIPSGWNMSLELGDLDRDGDLDALVTVSEGTGRVLLNDGGTQGGTTGLMRDSGQRLAIQAAFCVTLGDLDGDGDLDAFIGQEHANTIWFNDGQGAFSDSGQRLGDEITAAAAIDDLDGDGDLDVLAGGWDEPARVWLNDGTGIFADSGHDLTSAEVHIHAIALGDLDDDGDPDALLAIASGHPHQVWLNDGRGIFTDSGQNLHSTLGHGIALGDLDRDGDLDAFMANGTTAGSSNTVWLNDGQGNFSNSGLGLGSACSRSVALGDLDGDGDLDVFVANTDFMNQTVGKPNEVWFNETR